MADSAGNRTVQPTDARFVCREDFVLIRLVDTGRVGRVAVPQISSQGKRLIVVAIGPKVENLKVGDSVLSIGQVGVDAAQLPNDNDLFITKQSNIALIIKDVQMTPESGGEY